MKILLADDQHSIHIFLEGIIDWQELGIEEIIHAYDGEETFEMIVKQKPDITILDIEMPKLNGIDVLKKIKDIYFPKTIILSAFDKFQYARDAVELGAHNYILKPIDPVKMTQELELLIEEITAESKQQVEDKISHLIHYGTNQAVLDEIQHYFTTLRVQYFRAVYLKLLNDEKEENIQSLTSSLRNDHYVVPLGPLEHMIIQLDSKLITDESLAIISKSVESAHYTFIGGASQVESDVKQLPSMMEKSMEIAKMGFYQENTIHIYERQKFGKLEVMTVNALVQDFVENLEVGFISEEIMDSVLNVFSYAKKENVHPSHLYQFCFKLLNAMEQMASDFTYYLTMKELENEYQTFKELKQFLIKIIEDLDVFLSSQLSDQRELFERIKRYIQRNYSRELTLKHVAEKFHIDKYSLSKSFKKYFSINYGSFVTSVRMEKAIELLTSSDLKVHQIAEKVGYSDESTFSHAFKKIYGISPIGFRKKNE